MTNEEKPAALEMGEGWEQVVVSTVSIQPDGVGLSPPSGIVQLPVTLTSLTTCTLEP